VFGCYLSNKKIMTSREHDKFRKYESGNVKREKKMEG